MIKVHESQLSTINDEDQAAIRKLKQLLKERLSVYKLILFGSKARGDDTKDSDIDLMVVAKGDDYKVLRSTLSDIQFEVIMEIDSPLMCKLELESRWKSDNPEDYVPLREIILQEGIEIEL